MVGGGGGGGSLLCGEIARTGGCGGGVVWVSVVNEDIFVLFTHVSCIRFSARKQVQFIVNHISILILLQLLMWGVLRMTRCQTQISDLIAHCCPEHCNPFFFSLNFPVQMLASPVMGKQTA